MANEYDDIDVTTGSGEGQVPPRSKRKRNNRVESNVGRTLADAQQNSLDSGNASVAQSNAASNPSALVDNGNGSQDFLSTYKPTDGKMYNPTRDASGNPVQYTTDTPSANPVGGNQPTTSGNSTQQGGNQGSLFTLDDLGMDGKLPSTTSTTDSSTSADAETESKYPPFDYSLLTAPDPDAKGPQLKRTFRDLFLQQNPNTELTEEQLKKKARLEKAQKAISALGEIGTGIVNIIGARNGANALDTKSNVTLSEAARKRWEDWRKNYEERLAKYRAGMQQATKDDYAQLNRETDQQYRQRSLNTRQQNSYLNGLKLLGGQEKQEAQTEYAVEKAKQAKMDTEYMEENKRKGLPPRHNPDSGKSSSSSQKKPKAMTTSEKNQWFYGHTRECQRKIFHLARTNSPSVAYDWYRAQPEDVRKSIDAQRINS